MNVRNQGLSDGVDPSAHYLLMQSRRSLVYDSTTCQQISHTRLSRVYVPEMPVVRPVRQFCNFELG